MELYGIARRSEGRRAIDCPPEEHGKIETSGITLLYHSVNK